MPGPDATARKLDAVSAAPRRRAEVDADAILIWHADDPACAGLARTLAGLVPVRVAVGIDAIADAERAVLLVRAPSVAVATALAQDAAPSRALAEWTSEARTILAVLERPASDVRLVEAGRARHDLQATLDRLALSPEGDLQPEPAAAAETEPEAEWLLLALHTLQGDAAARDLALRLETHLIVIGGADEAPDAPDALHHRLQNARRLASERRDVEMARSASERRFIERENAAARGELEYLHAERMAAIAREADLDQRLAAAQDRIHWLEQDLTHLRGDIERILGSRSLRLTAPLRHLGAGLRRWAGR